VEADQLRDPDRRLGTGVDREVDAPRLAVLSDLRVDGAGGLDHVVDAAAEGHSAAARGKAEDDAEILRLAHPGYEHAAAQRAAARIAGLLLGPIVLNELGRDHHGSTLVEHGHLVLDRCDVAVHEGDESTRSDGDPLARRRHPEDLPVQGPGAHVQDALEAVQARPREVEPLVVHVEPDDLRIRQVDDRLPGGREAVGLLAVGDRPRLVEAVHEGPVFMGGMALFEAPPHAEVSVRQREERLRLRQEPRIETLLHEAPLVRRIDVVGRSLDFALDHGDRFSRDEARLCAGEILAARAYPVQSNPACCSVPAREEGPCRRTNTCRSSVSDLRPSSHPCS
jgi:hypothetical protein